MFSPCRSQASSEAARRRLLLETYTTPLGLNLKRDDNNDNENKEADILALQSFLSKFYASHYTQQSRMERKAILEQYEEVKLYHEQLVAKVLSVEEFWQRYFFRCDPDQILSEWDRNKSRQDSMGLKDVSKSMSSWMDSVKKAVFEEEEEGKTTKNNEQIEKRDTSDKKSSVSDSGKGVISSFLETCRKIDDSHAEAAAVAEAKHKKRKETEAKAKKIAEEKRRVTAEAEAQAKKQLEEDKRKRKAEQQKRQIEIEKQKLQQAASKTKSQKKEVVESKSTDSKPTFSLFGKGVSTKQKEEVPALIKSPVTSQHGAQSTPRKATPKSLQVKKKLFDWKAPKWTTKKEQDKSNPKAQEQQQEEERGSKLGSVTDKSKTKENNDDELHDKEAKSSGLWKLIICSYVMVLLSSIVISQRGHICNRNNRYLSPLLVCPATELQNKSNNNKRKKIKMKKQSV